MPDSAARIGLISDTHGLMRPAALDALRGCSLILHAGDVGRPEVLDSLRRLAPVVAVRGNVDHGEWASALPVTAAPSREVYMLHDLSGLQIDPAASGFRVVVSGHSHKHSAMERGGVLYINPGSAGPRRFRLPITVALLDPLSWTVSFLDLEADR